MPRPAGKSAEYSRRYREKYPERAKAAAARWRADHPAWWRKYAGTDGRRQQQRAYHEANRERRALRARERYRENSAKHIEWARRYQVAKIAATVEVVDYGAVRRRDKGRCGICGKKVPRAGQSFDHIKPISRGGEHSFANVQLAHLLCNLRKGAR